MKTGPTYWQRYDLVFKIYSLKKIFLEILNIAKSIGEPFYKKGKRGPKFKVDPEAYAAYTAFEIVTHNSPYRDMELGSELYLNEHIDHSTFAKNFEKTPYNYFMKLLEKIANMLDRLLGKAKIKIIDSTRVSTYVYEKKRRKLDETKERVDFKLHSLVSYHPKTKVIYFDTALATDKHTSDAEGAKQMIERKPAKAKYFADRAYDSERVYEQILEAEGIPIIKPRKGKPKMASCRSKGIKKYKPKDYKQIRGRIEVCYGGLENAGLLVTKLRKPDNINKRNLIIALKQNLSTLLRVSAKLFYGINRQTRF